MKIGKGYRTQSGLPVRKREKGIARPNGILFKGAVLATYVTDDSNHPRIEDLNNPPSAVYCDVVVYSTLAYNRWFTLSQVLVSQNKGGIHDDNIWKPKATSKNVTETLNDTMGANPGSLDGDHVLVGFLNNSFSEPIILRGLPHPSRDAHNELYDSGKRLKLKTVDGDPNFVKHHGVFSGVDDLGNFIVDTTFGNDGTTDSTGKEPNPDTTGSSGNQEHNLPQNSEFAITLKDMTNPLSPTEYAKFTIKKEDGNIEFIVDSLNSITVDGSGTDASLQLGNGAAKAAIADLLKVLWGLMKGVFDTHIHTAPSGPTGTPINAVGSPITCPSWDDNINSDRLTFPYN